VLALALCVGLLAIGPIVIVHTIAVGVNLGLVLQTLSCTDIPMAPHMIAYAARATANMIA
jgi:hypothetical protein